MIRLATAEDHSSILELAISFHKESIYSKYEFNEEKVEEFLHSSLATPHDFLFLVAEHKHKVVGLFFAIKTTLPLYKTTTTFEIAFYGARFEISQYTHLARLYAAFFRKCSNIPFEQYI